MVKQNICRLAIVLPIGLILIAVGIIVWFTVNTAIIDTVKNSAVILPKNDKSASINPWTRFVSNVDDPNNQRVYEYYVYNLTNPTEVIQGANPVYVELGPYKYQYYFNKLNLSLIDDDNVVTYQDYTYYVPILDDPSSSNPLTDSVYHVNLAYMAAVKQMGDEQTLGLILGGSSFQSLTQELSSDSLRFAIGTIYSTQIIATIISNLVQYYTAYPVNTGGFDEDPTLSACHYWAGYTGYASSMPSSVSSQIPATFPFSLTFGPVPFTLDDQICYQLFTDTNPFAFNNPAQTAFGVWLKAANDVTYQTLIYQTLVNATGGDPTNFPQTTFNSIFKWQTFFKANTSETYALSTQPMCADPTVCLISYMGMVQWGQKGGMLQGQSVASLTGISGTPEFGILMDYDLTLAQVQYLWNSSNPLSLMTSTSVVTLTTLVAKQNNTLIMAYSGGLIDLTLGALLVEYMQKFTADIAYPTLVSMGGGPVVKNVVNDYLFHYNDPLLMSLYPSDPSKWNAAPLSNYSESDASKYLPMEKSYTGNDDAVKSQEHITNEGEETVQYAVPIQVYGHSSENLGPYYLRDNEDPPVELFSPEFSRTLNMYREYTGNEGGLKYYRYRIKDSDWMPNATMYTSIAYLMNMTSAKGGVPVFPSRPRMKGMDTTYFTKCGLGSLVYDTEDNDVFGDYEPVTGKAINGRYSIQVNYYVEGANGKNSSLFNFVNTFAADVVHPMIWGKNEVTATSSQINLIRTSYRVDAFRYALTTILFVIGGIMVISVIGLYIIDNLISKGFFNDAN